MPSAAKGLTTVDHVKVAGGIGSSPNSELIETLIAQITDEIEMGIGVKLIETPYADVLDGTALGALVLPHRPVIAFDNLTLNGTVVDSTTYEVNKPAGLVLRVSNGVETAWAKGTRNYIATYTAGYKEIPGGLERIATRIVVRMIHTDSKDRQGIVSLALPSGGSTTFIPDMIQDDEWKALRTYGSAL